MSKSEKNRVLLARPLAGLAVVVGILLALAVACGPSAPLAPTVASPAPAFDQPPSTAQGAQPQAPPQAPPAATPSPQRPPFTPSPPTFIPATPRPTPASLEEELRRRAEDERQGPKLTPNPPTGPATKGKAIFIAGRVVQLPPDAYVEKDGVLIGDCITADPQCLAHSRGPFTLIRRGNSTIAVLWSSGGISFGESIAPGEEGAFNFLKEALR